ncbi:MAG: glycosyltransferase family 2 protein [Candidatus Saccharimonadales bacterium]
MKLVVFSICKDESATIGQVLDGIPASIPGIDEIEKVVISDGSSDDTAIVASKHGARVVDSRNQKGLAYRFRQAVELALDESADIAVGIDGDMQFNPADIPKLVKPIVEDGQDFVSANRFVGGRPKDMPIGKYLANRLGAWVVSKLTGEKFPDVTCGFRSYSKRALIALNLNGKQTYTQESFQILAMKRLNIVTIPIKVKYYPGRKSRVVTSFSKFLFGSALNILRAYRDFAPLKFFGTLGSIPFVTGAILSIFVINHWLSAGSITPYKAIGFIGIYLVSIGLVLWVLGLVADMLHRINNNQEKILEETKRIRYDDKE